MNEAIVEARSVPHPRSRGRMFAIVGSAALILASVGLFLVSRGKWSDAIIDSGREWIVPDALARGDLLYRDVVYWFGPFTPYFHAAFFKLLGSSFRTLVVAGVVGSIGVLAALYFALRSVTGRREAALWTALAVPVLVFMPNAGGSILGMGYRMWHAAGFALAAIALVARSAAWWSFGRALGIGALCGFAGLCRTEWGIGVLIAVLVAGAARKGQFRGRLLGAATVILGALTTFGAVVASFAVVAGPGTILSDAPVLLVGIPELTRRNVLAAPFRGWRDGISPLLYSSAMWGAAFLLIELAAVGWRDHGRVRRRVLWLLPAITILLLTASTGGVSGASLLSAAPVVCFGALVTGLRRAPGPCASALTGFGIAGLLLSHRRFFFITDAPYVAPVLLFTFCCAAGLVQVKVDSERDGLPQYRIRTAMLSGVAVLVALAFAERILRYKGDERLAVPGTAGMLSAAPDTSREMADVARAVRSLTLDGDGLVVFPEGEALNYLSRRHNPLRHKLYLPGYLTERNEEDILREMRRKRPSAIVIWSRPTGEYGRALFSEGYGARIRTWISENYVARRYQSSGRPQALLFIHR